MVGRREPTGSGTSRSAGSPDTAMSPRDAGSSDAGPSDAGPSDADLLLRHVAGDPEAFGLLFQRHKDRLWAVALRTTCDPEDAADALQEAMISAFRRAKDFRGDSAVTTWLHRIVVNASLDRLRRRPARSVSWSGDADALDALIAQDSRGAPAQAVPSPRAGAGLLPGAPSTDPADSIETRLDIDAALRMLPPQQRAPLVLVDMLGYPVAEVAVILAVSEGTVKSRCARGRARLLPHLAHLRGDSRAVGNQPAADAVSPEQLPFGVGEVGPTLPGGGG
jgi:RNA polymerase sigma-70 factor, ECF subfamily